MKQKLVVAISALLLTICAGTAITPKTRARNKAFSGDQPRDEKLWKEALRIQKEAIVVDTHNDVTTPMTDEDYDIGTSSVGRFHTDIARMKAGGLSAEFFSIYVDKKYAAEGGSARR